MRLTHIALLNVGAALICATAAQAAPEPNAGDGQSLTTQSPATQNLFQSVWGAGAASHWIDEHVAQLTSFGIAPGLSSAPGQMLVAPKPEPVLVIMNDKDQYSPSMLSVPRGTTVTWRNDDTDPHTITGDPAKSMPGMIMVLPAGAQAWDSGLIEEGKSFSFTFDTLGHYIYMCTVHAGHGMVATLDVTS